MFLCSLLHLPSPLPTEKNWEKLRRENPFAFLPLCTVLLKNQKKTVCGFTVLARTFWKRVVVFNTWCPTCDAWCDGFFEISKKRNRLSS